MILLTTPYDPGDLDTQSYTHVQIRRFGLDLRRKAIDLEICYGYLDSGNFVEGKSVAKRMLIKDRPNRTPATTHFTDLIATMGVDSKTVYDQAAEGLYNHLISEGLYPGTLA